jgi:hypothetical protein
MFFRVQGKSLNSHCLSCNILSLAHHFRDTSLFFRVPYQLVSHVFFFLFSSSLISFIVETEHISLLAIGLNIKQENRHFLSLRIGQSVSFCYYLGCTYSCQRFEPESGSRNTRWDKKRKVGFVNFCHPRSCGFLIRFYR